MSSSYDSYGGFYQFPLCLLARKIPFNDLLNQTFDWGVVHYLNEKHGAAWRSAAQKDEAFAEARATIGFTGGTPGRFHAVAQQAEEFKTKWIAKYGQKTYPVRFRASDLNFDVRDKRILSEREWRILAAVYSAVGEKQMVKLGWKGIQYRAAGWLTQPPQNAELVGPFYSRGQIERSLSRLLTRGYLVAATYRRGERYWTNRATQQELWEAITVRKLIAARRTAERKRIDEERNRPLAVQIALLSHGGSVERATGIR